MKKILFLKSNPVDTQDLRLENEERELIRVWETSQLRAEYEVVTRGAVTREDLTTHLNLHQPDILHISGHGSEDLNLFLEGDKGFQVEVPVEKVLSLLENYRNLELVFFNTCYSLAFDQEIDCKIPHIIGMKDKVPNTYAIDFSREFYKGLLNGMSISRSYGIALDFQDLTVFPRDHIPKMITSKMQVPVSAGPEKEPDLLVSDAEIGAAKKLQILVQRRHIGLLGLLMTACVGIVVMLVVMEVDILYVLSMIVPASIGGYPFTQINKRSEKLSLIELFELKLEKYRDAYDPVSHAVTEKLNDEFLTILKL